MLMLRASRNTLPIIAHVLHWSVHPIVNRVLSEDKVWHWKELATLPPKSTAQNGNLLARCYPKLVSKRILRFFEMQANSTLEKNASLVTGNAFTITVLNGSWPANCFMQSASSMSPETK